MSFPRDSVKRFFQVIINKGIISQEEAVEECMKIFHNREAVRVILTINEEIKPLNLEIKSGKDEFTGETFWTLVGLVKDDKMSILTKFTEKQVSFLRAIFCEIIHREEGYIPSIDALNFSNEGEIRLSQLEADNVIKDMTRSKWLELKDGNIFIGIRSIIELMSHFRDEWGMEIKICQMCNNYIFHGHKCENCYLVYHLYCLAHVAKVHGGEARCPNCTTPLAIEELPNMELESTANGYHGSADDDDDDD